MKIPKEAKKVFTGVIFDVLQWEQLMYDGSTATFEALKRPSTVQIIPIIGDKILLSSEIQPHYDARRVQILGGRAEHGEEPLTAAKREFLEEAGIVAKSWELFKTYPVGGKIDWDVYYFIAKDCRKVSEQHLDAGERIDVKSVSFEEFVELVTTEGFDSFGFSNDLIRMRLEPLRLEAFRKQLFS